MNNILANLISFTIGGTEARVWLIWVCKYTMCRYYL